ncbi:MAG: ATP-binding protein [Deltaproteobacteria bacterium]|nr:ATP-binding protein [Deltaproteobacteria bacterium]
MNAKTFKPRLLAKLLPNETSRRIVVITGARQTGKTTLSRRVYEDLKYVNLDAPENRDTMRDLSTVTWGEVIGNAVIDEAHKEPTVFEKVKYAFDEDRISFTVLTGSSQILLLRKIRESLAGRAFFYELWPLVQSEIRDSGDNGVEAPLLLDLVVSGEPLKKTLGEVPDRLLETQDYLYRASEKHVMEWGGMPALLELPEERRWQWLRNYGYTYLERDLRDLARLDDLMPFRKFHRLSAMTSGMLLNYSELARDASVSVDTARRYLEYLRISYQTALLQPYYKNLTSSVVKTPKLYWTDVGIWRQLTGFRGEMSGQLYETMVVSELYKWIHTTQQDVEMFFYRTRAGMEIDILLETGAGLIGFEIKSRDTVSERDARPLKVVAEALGSAWLGGIVLYTGNRIRPILSPNIWAIPSRRLFQPAVPGD